MITELILKPFLLLAEFLVEEMPSFNLLIPIEIEDNITSFFKYIGYFLPVPLLVPLLVFEFSLRFGNMTMAMFSRVKSLIPFMGD